jgi:hypothetical protein
VYRKNKPNSGVPSATCKNGCGKPGTVYSKWCSGEFCSKACANSYATKAKRKEINEKVGKKIARQWANGDYNWLRKVEG